MVFRGGSSNPQKNTATAHKPSSSVTGNASVTLTDGKKITTYEIWLQRINTASMNEFSNQQVKEGMSWLPIRRAEMFFNFAALWPFIALTNTPSPKGFEDIPSNDGFARMNKFQDAIRTHQLAIINNQTTEPMILEYYNNSSKSSPNFNTLISQEELTPIRITGQIQSVEKQYIRFQSMFVTNYAMNILQPNVSNTPPTSMLYSVSYAPTVSDQQKYGFDWINTNSLTQATNQIQGLP